MNKPMLVLVLCLCAPVAAAQESEWSVDSDLAILNCGVKFITVVSHYDVPASRDGFYTQRIGGIEVIERADIHGVMTQQTDANPLLVIIYGDNVADPQYFMIPIKYLQDVMKCLN